MKEVRRSIKFKVLVTMILLKIVMIGRVHLVKYFLLEILLSHGTQ